MQADRPSLLSKIFGIYSIKIQDFKTGEKKKLDMIVMDNLFHSQSQFLFSSSASSNSYRILNLLQQRSLVSLISKVCSLFIRLSLLEIDLTCLSI